MNSELGKFVKEKRGQKSLRDYAALIGISHSHLDSIEKGFDYRTGNPLNLSGDVLDKIATATNTDVAIIHLMSKGMSYDAAVEKVKEGYQDFVRNINLKEKTNDEKLIELMKMAENNHKLKMIFDKASRAPTDKELDKIAAMIDLIIEEDKHDDYGC